jgi:signal transduction histidine kinase/DNA-binding response OmpR family regulator
VVYGVLSDEEGNIWGSTNKGLFCLIQSGLEQDAYHFKNFSKSDGLQEEEFNTNSFAKLPNGKLMFGGVNGYNVFLPADVLDESVHPQVHITDLKINNNKVHTDEENGILAKSILFTDAITLQPSHEILTISFASLDYTDPLRNKYRYKMKGLDDSWIMAGNQQSATFVQLSPGKYTFMVEATDSHGVWSDHSDMLEVIVLPPWYQTWWAYAAYLLLIVSVSYFFFRLYDRRQKLNQALAFEKRESDRVRELEYQKSQLFMNMTHEFRTPLTIILGKAKQMNAQANKQAKNGFEMIIRNGEHLLNMVNDMLDISKLDSGKLKINATNTDIVTQLEHKLGLFKTILKEKNIHLHYLPEMDSFLYRYDVQKMNHIITNLISNAVKFTDENGHIYVMLAATDTSLVLKVKDTGSGISKEALPYIFDRFYQEDNSITRKSDGTGIGLSLTKELVMLMNGNIKVYSPPKGANIGTEFVISLPCEKQIANPVEKSTIDGIVNGTDNASINVNPAIPTVESSTVNAVLVEDKTPTNQFTISNTKNLLILVVEDNADVRKYVLSCISDVKLFKNRKINLETAENGEIGLEKAISLVPDLIISDVMMPLMDGFDLIDRLKKNTATNHIPVILLTARADMKSKLEGLELGANAYLPKPFEPQELVYNIKNLIAYRDKIQQRIQKRLHGRGMPQENVSDRLDKIIPNQENKFVQKIQSYIEANISDADLSVTDIAKEIHLSHSQFARKLAALTGYSPSQFLKTIRLAHAIKLLNDESSSSITAIAYDSGFNDPGYFIKVFKKEYGVTPGQWNGFLGH